MKKESTAARSRRRRHARILSLYDEMRDQHGATETYMAISRKVGCCYATVIRVLKSNNKI